MNKIDLLFIVDITGSMGGFIADAQKRIKGILDDLTKQFELDLRVGLSLYKDHASQGDPYVTATFKLDTVDATKAIIDQIQVGVGGDVPESVLDGIIDGIEAMEWREGSRRIAFLIADAPAHGMIDGEFECQCGKTPGEAIIAASKNGVILYSVLLGNNQEAQDNLKTLAVFTGGSFIKTEDAISAISDTLKMTLEDSMIKRE